MLQSNEPCNLSYGHGHQTRARRLLPLSHRTHCCSGRPTRRSQGGRLQLHLDWREMECLMFWTPGRLLLMNTVLFTVAANSPRFLGILFYSRVSQSTRQNNPRNWMQKLSSNRSNPQRTQLWSPLTKMALPSEEHLKSTPYLSSRCTPLS